MMRKPTSLREELRQSRPFESPAQEAILALRRTSDLMQRELVKALDPTGLSPQQYNVLRILRGAGEMGLPTLDIAERMVEKAPGITRLLDKLEAKDLVRRRRCPGDRRQVLCWITSKGLDLLSELDRPIAALGPRLLQGLPEHEILTLLQLLGRVRAGLD